MVSIPGINRILLHLLGTVRKLNMIKKRNTEKVGGSVEYVDRVPASNLNFQDSSGVRIHIGQSLVAKKYNLLLVRPLEVISTHPVGWG